MQPSEFDAMLWDDAVELGEDLDELVHDETQLQIELAKLRATGRM